MQITGIQRAFIISRLESLFGETKARLLGRFFKGSGIFFEVARQADPMHTVEGLYTYTLNMLHGAGIRPSERTIEQLSEITGNYIDAQGLKVINHVLADVARANSPNEAIRSIRTHLDKTSKYLKMLVTNETKIVQVYASKEGITRLAADTGVTDPTVVFHGVTDHKICKYCKTMYHDSANIRLPKPYKLSQVNEGYFRAKEWDGKTPYQVVHPHCRHSMSYVPPNYGFNSNGYIEFKDFGYNYYNDYWKTKKSEDWADNLQKTDTRFMSYDEYLQSNADHECDGSCNHD